MRLNSGNRAFFTLVGIAFAAYQLLGAGGCALFGSLLYGLSTGEMALGTSLWGTTALGLFLVVYILGWAFAVASFVRQTTATLKLRGWIRDLRLHPPPSLEESARRVGLHGRVDLVDSEDVFSFAYGVFGTRVAVSRALVTRVTVDELDAILTHERYHIRNWDPLKVFIARLLARALFFLPIVSELRHRYVAGRELAADRRALRAHGQQPLASALYKVVSGPLWSELGAAAAIGGPDHLDARVAQLESGKEPPGVPIPAAAWVASTTAAIALVASFVAAVATLGGPMAMMDRSMMDGSHEMDGPAWFWSAAFSILVLATTVYLFRRSRSRSRRLTTTSL